jgi:uncharacterized protein (DUF1800 family)
MKQFILVAIACALALPSEAASPAAATPAAEASGLVSPAATSEVASPVGIPAAVTSETATSAVVSPGAASSAGATSGAATSGAATPDVSPAAATPATATDTPGAPAHAKPSAAASSLADTRIPVGPNHRILHVLNRLTFGPRPGDIEAVKAMGLEAYIQHQLHPASIREADSVQSVVPYYDALRLDPLRLYQNYGPAADKLAQQKAMQSSIVFDRNNRNRRKGGQQRIFDDVSQAKILRAVESPRQLQEVMVDFWFNHFNIYANKGLDHIWIGAYEEQAIRPNALGKFGNLVEATCHHPAMIFYLDNSQNSAPGRKGPNGAPLSGLNENYARELMELHTLGVDGGYSQRDVTELARILTGLGLAKMDGKDAVTSGNGVYFDSTRHDFGTKTLLGHVIRGTGQDEIEQALNMLIRSRATAHHVCYQLAQYFVSDSPPRLLVDRLTTKFTQTDGDITEVLNTLFHSPEFWSPQYEDCKFKSPFRYLISTLRAADARPGRFDFAVQFLREQGMPLYGCLTPDGYKNTRDAWVNPDTLLKRITFASKIAVGAVPEVPPYAIEYRRLGATLGGTFSGQTVRVVVKAPELLRPALLLASPEFMKY